MITRLDVCSPKRSLFGLLRVRRQVALIAALFILAIAGILAHTIMLIHGQKSDAVVIDLAGRQRMLHEKHMKEVLLVSQGFPADYRYTRQLLNETLEALITGGPAVHTFGGKETVLLPPVPTEEIKAKLEEQARLVGIFTAQADVFLRLDRKDPAYAGKFEELLHLSSGLHTTANDAVKMLDQYSGSKVAKMIAWEVAVTILVILLGIMLTRQVIRANQELAHEITERQRMQEELRSSEQKRMEALRQSDDLKSALLSSVSHELRTPLTAMKTMVSSLGGNSQTVTGEVREEFLQNINQDIDYLNRLVDNLLDMSKIEAGTLIPQREWHLVEDLIEGAIRRLGKLPDQRSLDLSLADDLPSIFVDGVEMQQVLVNLLDNAVKYSPSEARISLHVQAQPTEIHIRVSNPGPGIPAEELDRVFDRFYRVRTKHGRAIPGTGLGLAICKAIVEAHGGRIWAESRPGQETTIGFTIPVSADRILVRTMESRSGQERAT